MIGKSIEDYLCTEYLKHLKENDPIRKLIINLILFNISRSKSLVMLLDGLDEVPKEELRGILEVLAPFINKNETRVVISMRPLSRDPAIMIVDENRVHVSIGDMSYIPFDAFTLLRWDDEKLISDGFKRFAQCLGVSNTRNIEQYTSKILNDPLVMRLASNPLYLFGLAHQVITAKDIDSRECVMHNLIIDILSRAFARYWSLIGVPPFKQNDCFERLSCIAYWVLKNRTQVYIEKIAINQIYQQCKNMFRDSKDVDDFLHWASEHADFFDVNNKGYSWKQIEFRDYFAAYYISNCANPIQELEDIVSDADSSYSTILAFLAGKLGHDKKWVRLTDLITWLLDRVRMADSPGLWYTTQLWLHTLAEIPSKWVDSSTGLRKTMNNCIEELIKRLSGQQMAPGSGGHVSKEYRRLLLDTLPVLKGSYIAEELSVRLRNSDIIAWLYLKHPTIEELAALFADPALQNHLPALQKYLLKRSAEDHRFRERLGELVHDNNHPQFRSAVARAIVVLKIYPHFRTVLEAAFELHNQSIIDAIKGQMGKMPEKDRKSLEPVLIQALHNGDPWTKWNAVKLCCKMKKRTQLSPQLRQALKKTAEWARQELPSEINVTSTRRLNIEEVMRNSPPHEREKLKRAAGIIVEYKQCFEELETE